MPALRLDGITVYASYTNSYGDTVIAKNNVVMKNAGAIFYAHARFEPQPPKYQPHEAPATPRTNEVNLKIPHVLIGLS